jgi:hypothetical protein
MNTLFLILAITQGPATVSPAVIDLDGGPPRQVIVILSDQAYRVWTRPVFTPDPSPTPGPTPGPTPDPTPTPIPTPVAAFGPLARVLILYETSSATGREPFYSLDFVESIGRIVPVEDGVPAYRCWDFDVDASRMPGWSGAKVKSSSMFNRADGPHLVAFDAEGRTRLIPIPVDMTPEQLLAEVQKLAP